MWIVLLMKVQACLPVHLLNSERVHCLPPHAAYSHQEVEARKDRFMPLLSWKLGWQRAWQKRQLL